jgi:tRNA (cytidine/uridine-2'-O-)-methyltransferase
MIEIALYQPDIASNTATILRLAACLGLRVRIIEPAGFVWSESAFRRAGMDYLARADVVREASFAQFLDHIAGRRLILFSTRGKAAYNEFSFAAGDVLLFGRESSGVPGAVAARADHRLVIPMRAGLRSLNVALAAAMAAGEALRQTGGFGYNPAPGPAPGDEGEAT